MEALGVSLLQLLGQLSSTIVIREGWGRDRVERWNFGGMIEGGRGAMCLEKGEEVLRVWTRSILSIFVIGGIVRGDTM